MDILGVIIARAGSKGLPDKCVRRLHERAVIEYSFDHALASRNLSAVVLSTDSVEAQRLGRARALHVIDRPASLAGDLVPVDDVLRHAVESWETTTGRRADAVVMLYGNIPVRAEGSIDRAIEHLTRERCSSVRTVAPIGRHHPDWLHRLDGDRMSQYRMNSIYRRQDLEPLYYHDGAVIAVTRDSLFAAKPGDAQSFLGSDRRAIVQRCEDAVDIDDALDLRLAAAVMARDDFDAGSDAPLIRRIGNRIIGDSHPTYIIAEAGVNHDGSFADALRMVDAAADAGADAVKFQIFTARKLARQNAPTAAYQRKAGGGEDQQALLASLELSAHDFERLAAHAHDRGIDFLATPFGIDDLATLRRLAVPAIKIASTDLDNVLLLEPAAALRLPLILSTGASTAIEIDAAVARLREWSLADRSMLLHCVSAYPTPPEAANIGAISQLARRTGLPVGYSDHTMQTRTGAQAVAAGACILEKHFTLDRSRKGPDHAMSLPPGELREYVERARDARTMLGSATIGMSAIEQDVRRVGRKSLCYSRSLTAGTRISREMLVAKRPGDGIPPAEFEQVIGRALAVDVQADIAAEWNHLV